MYIHCHVFILLLFSDKVIVEIEENPNKRHRRTIKLSDKVEIIRLIENGQTQVFLLTYNYLRKGIYSDQYVE